MDRLPMPQAKPPALLLALALVLATWAAALPAARADDEAARYVQFVEDDAAKCVARDGVQIQVRSTHPSRRIKVWLDRMRGTIGTGDRSRSELAPGAEPEPLGCSRDQGLPQSWKLVRAEFID